MSILQCEDCRLGLLDAIFDLEAGEAGGYVCQLDETKGWVLIHGVHCC